MNLTIARVVAVTLPLVLSGAGSASADNLTPATARIIAMNSTAQKTVALNDTAWYKVRLFANRSYQASGWGVNDDDNRVGVFPLEFTDLAGAVLAPGPQTATGVPLEGTPNDESGAPHTVFFQPTATGVYLLRVATHTNPGSVNIMIRETTLFSPWFFVTTSNGYDAFHEIRNTTAQPVTVTLRAFGSLGTQLGVTHTFTVPGNATVVKSTKTDLSVAGDGTFGGTVLTHNAAFGAIAANTTTLSNQTGLSFDSPYTPRDPNLIGAPIR